MNGNERREARILIALSTEIDARLALDIHRYLLGDAPPRLVGLLVEDPRLLAHAGAALAREIGLSGTERRLEPASLERQLRARWSQLRRLFETEGARLGIEAELEVVREERRVALARAIERADALVVERDAAADALELWSSLAPPAPLRALMLAPARWPVGGDVVMLVDRRMLDALCRGRGAPGVDAALRIARRTGAPLTVLVEGSVGDDTRMRLERIARFAGVRLGAVAEIRHGSLAALAEAARGARVLLLPPGIDPRIAAALAARLHGATVLWRAPGEADRKDE